jgi:hypothetical protein
MAKGGPTILAAKRFVITTNVLLEIELLRFAFLHRISIEVVNINAGGMHAWLWGEQYPAFMDAIIPVACQPDKIAGRNLLWRRIITSAVRSDPEWNGGDYHRPPSSLARVYPILKLVSSNAAQLQQEVCKDSLCGHRQVGAENRVTPFLFLPPSRAFWGAGIGG